MVEPSASQPAVKKAPETEHNDEESIYETSKPSSDLATSNTDPNLQSLNLTYSPSEKKVGDDRNNSIYIYWALKLIVVTFEALLYWKRCGIDTDWDDLRIRPQDPRSRFELQLHKVMFMLREML